MTTDRDNSELLLTAFRYVAAELPARDAADFEELLSRDQSARDALADVVELAEAVAVEEFERIHPLRHDADPPARRSVARWGVAAAVCLVVVVCFVLGWRENPQDVAGPTDVKPVDPVPLAEMGDAHSVISLWSELGDNIDQFGSDSFLSDESEVIPPTPNEIPDWMLMAVVSGAEQPASDMPDEMRELMNDPDRENL